MYTAFMFNVINTSLSGVLAASNRVETSARNLVNSGTTSPTKAKQAENPAFRIDRAYIPEKSVQIPLKGGGVRTENIAVKPASLSIFSPYSPISDDQGLVEVPNIDPTVEIAEINRATHAYKSNAAVLKKLDQTFEGFLESIK